MSLEVSIAILLFLAFGLSLLGLRALIDWEWERGKRLTWREVRNLLLTGRPEGRIKEQSNE